MKNFIWKMCIKPLEVLMMVSSLLFLAPTISNANLLSTFKANGDTAYASWSDSSGSAFSFGYINVSKGGPPNNPQTYVSYYIYKYDSETFYSDVSFGGGLIPNSDLTGSGEANLTLNTDTSRINGGYYGTGGAITIEWKKSPANSTHTSGTIQNKYGNFLYTFSGVSYQTSASATGSVTGNAIVNAGVVYIGTNNNVSITVEKVP